MLFFTPKSGISAPDAVKEILAAIKSGKTKSNREFNTWISNGTIGTSHISTELKGKGTFTIEARAASGAKDPKELTIVTFNFQATNSNDPNAKFIYAAYHSELLQFLITYFQYLTNTAQSSFKYMKTDTTPKELLK